MIWSASVLSAPSADTEPTIIINFDTAKYIFNVGENTGRSFMEGRHNWKNTKALFLTSVGTQRASGLPGMFMLLADASFKKMDVVGPPGITHWLASMRGYLYRSGMQVKCLEMDFVSPAPSSQPPPVYQDEQITVYGIPLSSRSDIITQDKSEPFVEQAANTKRKRALSRERSPKRQRILQDSEVRKATSTSTGESSLIQKSESFDFVPADLRGAEAQEWRQLVVDSMFPCTMPSKPNDTPKGKQGKREGKDQPNLDNETPITSSSAPLEDTLKVPLISNRTRSRRLPSAPAMQSPPRFCYICVGPRVRGKFDVKKAKELEIPNGPIRRRLINGEAITFPLSDGKGGTIERTVRPEEIVQPPETPKVVIIIDMATPDQIPQLESYFTEHPFYRQFRSKLPENAERYVVSTVFHLCGKDVLEDARYKDFINGFSDSANHVVSSREQSPDRVAFGSAAYNQLKLNQLDSAMFPTQIYRNEPLHKLSDVTGLPPNVVLLEPNLNLSARPPRSPVVTELPENYSAVYAAVTGSVPLELPAPTLNAFARARERYAEIEANLQSGKEGPRPGDDVVVVPLGTSSALPNRYRNVSSTLVQIPGWGSLLLDAGEGTWGQLARLFGDDSSRSKGVWQFLRELKCIFLSHIHGDHHIGAAKVLAMRKQLDPPPSEPLYLIGVRQQLLYLREMSDIEDLGLDAPGGAGVISILSDALNWRRPAPYYDRNSMDAEPWTDWNTSRAAARDMCRSLGLTSFTTVDVEHGTRCYGAVVKHLDAWSIVFAADTKPTDNLVQAGQNATLLIHEATMADDQEDMARAKHHSTFSQAIDIGRRMHAENILLTHFSARYPKMPQSEAMSIKADAAAEVARVQTGEAVSEAAAADLQSEKSGKALTTPVLGLAFDLAKIRIGDMRKLNTYLPAIEQSFVETLDDDEEPDAARDPW